MRWIRFDDCGVKSVVGREEGEDMLMRVEHTIQLVQQLLAPHSLIVAYQGERPRVVCLCGSTRFMDAFFAEGWRLTLAGEIVLSVGVCKHAEHHGAEALGQDVADRLDELHLRKIDLADYVRVLNVNGYVGPSTRKEIEYAERTGKPVEYLEPAKPKRRK